MTARSVSVTFACYNQVEYTRRCVQSLIHTGMDLSRVVAVDNASSDETSEYLSQVPLGGHVRNRQNLGCGVAWNQGALAQQTDWTIVMNNDVIVSSGWLDGLIDAGERQGLHLVSPALIEGPLDYNFDAFAADASQRLGQVSRLGGKHAVCMAIHRSVWDAIGYFRATPSLWGYEDTLFFDEFDRAGLKSAIVGSAWLHHYGSITLSAMKRERGLAERDGLSARRTYRLLGQSVFLRKWRKLKRKNALRQWRDDELRAHGMTLHGTREDGTFAWR